MFRVLCILDLLCYFISTVDGNGNGLLLLYSPRDISNDCAFSQRLRYSVSFGMGMSDTITLTLVICKSLRGINEMFLLIQVSAMIHGNCNDISKVLRTLTEVDYECGIEVVTENQSMLVVVVKYPTGIGMNCATNPDAFTVLKKKKCVRLCDVVGDRDIFSPYFVFVAQGRVRIRFTSNSSINSDINANMYQITATAARRKPEKDDCMKRNETLCTYNAAHFCFTSGVVCDGIVNCGVNDWFDERKSTCGLPVERLGVAPVIAVIAAILCALLAAGHVLLRCLPPLASSFFIFNANEDNRLCIDPILEPAGDIGDIELAQKRSLIPVSNSTSSSNSDKYDRDRKQSIFKQFTIVEEPMEATEADLEENATVKTKGRISRIKFISKMLQNTFHNVSNNW